MFILSVVHIPPHCRLAPSSSKLTFVCSPEQCTLNIFTSLFTCLYIPYEHTYVILSIYTTCIQYLVHWYWTKLYLHNTYTYLRQTHTHTCRSGHISIVDMLHLYSRRRKYSEWMAWFLQEDPFQLIESPKDLEEMGDQPPPPNTARCFIALPKGSQQFTQQLILVLQLVYLGVWSWSPTPGTHFSKQCVICCLNQRMMCFL